MKAENVEVKRDDDTKLYRALCNIEGKGEIIYWGATAIEAKANLKGYVVDVLKAEWPEGE